MSKALFLILIIASFGVQSLEIKSTTVIFDGGGRSTEGYIKKILIKSEAPIPERYPVRTEELTVGRVGNEEAKDVPFEMAIRPLFIIGYDKVSVSWLKKNKQLLISKKAVGYVVNVKSKKELDYISEVLQNKINLIAIDGADLAKQLKIKHYPFYMDDKGVMR